MLEQQCLSSNIALISQTVTHIINQYCAALEGEHISGLYQLILEAVEKALLAAVMPHFQYNQVRTAKSLGLSRATLRKMIIQYFGTEFYRSKEW